MPERPVSRREFLGTSAAAGALLAGGRAAGAAPTAEWLSPRPRAAVGAPSDRVRFGIVGVGMQGSGLLANSIALPGVECAGACDLYDGRHTLAREIAGPALRVTRRYQDLLDDKGLDAVVVAVPDHWHRRIVVDALRAGKDVYCEKPMSHTPADGVAMLDAATGSGRVVQVGSQRVSAQITARARDLLARHAVGDLTLVEGWIGRNDPSGAWLYEPPPDLSPATLDWDTWQGAAPRRPFDPKAFAGWRAYREYGTGVAGDLLVHLVSGLMFMLGITDPPSRVMAVGGVRRWHDGRTLPDVMAVTFDYGGLPVYLRLNLGTAATETYRFQGAKGVLELTNGTTLTLTPQTGENSSPSWYVENSYPRAMREAFERRWYQENAGRLAREATTEVTTIRGPNYDDRAPHLAAFFDAVRSRQPVVEDARFGHHAALACHMANASYFGRTAVTWDAAARSIRG
jgi:predicted dehydrogenase